MGIYLRGLFLQYDEFQNDDGSVRYSISVAVGNYSYRVYMADGFDPEELGVLSLGNLIQLQARPYVNKNNRLTWSDGKDLKIE